MRPATPHNSVSTSHILGLKHFTAFQKWAYFWMKDVHVAMAAKLGSGKYKIYAQDKANANEGSNYLLVMVRGCRYIIVVLECMLEDCGLQLGLLVFCPGPKCSFVELL